MLANKAHKDGALVLELTPEDYSYEMLATSLRSEKEGSWAKFGAYTSSWKYLLLILAMKVYADSGPKLKRGSQSRIYSFLRDRYVGHQENPIAMLISYLKRIEGVKVGGYGASLRTQELQSLYKLDELTPYMDDLRYLCQQRPIYIFVDELDRGWDSSEDAKAFVAGLFQASLSLNNLSDGFRVYVSLRRELSDSIPELFDDIQKYRDIIETISWDESSLLALVAKRIKYSLPELGDADDEEAWNEIFLETIQYRKSKSFNYIVDRTLYRPREVIQFCTDCVEAAKAADNFPVDYPVISSAELGYSENRTRDIAAEYRFQYPGLMSVFEAFRGRSYSMDRVDLELVCLSIATGEITVDEVAGSWTDGIDPDSLIEILWRIGFLRAYAVGGVKAVRRSGSSYVGPHQVSHLNVHDVQRFHVHPMFRAFLGLKEAKSGD
ncbi:hypothetical protein DEM34_01170 [Spiribacter halobius]|uniref:Uncharacterized protein n=1 Tax=Sediminicurvatus halobius TaxID=2182432 RepID=A0A2U2N8X4_9GAMM|nr:hypothetical protein DEM34_01170 [Spiribacter halobius]